jgi:hypothetical protein
MVVSFTPRSIYRRGNSLQYKLNKKLGGPQSRFGSCGLENNLLALAGIEPRSSSPQSVALPTELYQLPSSIKAYFNDILSAKYFLSLFLPTLTTVSALEYHARLKITVIIVSLT